MTIDHKLVCVGLVAMIAAGLVPSDVGASPDVQRAPPASTRFKIPGADAKFYRADVYDGILSINSQIAALLNPDGARAGRRLPESAWVRPTPMHVEEYAIRGAKRFCRNQVADDIRHNYPDQGPFHFFESAMAAATTDRTSYRFFVSLDGRWVARCWIEAKTCIALVADPKWVGRLNIFEADLCNVPEMAQRLSAIVNRWVR